jgi:hypothetical protein
VRRRHPPPTTAPLDDDFDAVTAPTASVWMGRQTRATSRYVMRDDFDAVTAPTMSVWTENPRAPPSPVSSEGRDEDEPDAVTWTGPASRHDGHVHRRRPSTNKQHHRYPEFERTEEYVYRGDLDASEWGGRTFNDEDIRMAFVNGGVLELETEVPATTETITMRRRGPETGGGRKMGSSKDSGGRKHGDVSGSLRGYEKSWDGYNDEKRSFRAQGDPRMIEKRVIEDGPERTVSIWRQEVARNSGPDDGWSAADSHAHRKLKARDRERELGRDGGRSQRSREGSNSQLGWRNDVSERDGSRYSGKVCSGTLQPYHLASS